MKAYIVVCLFLCLSTSAYSVGRVYAQPLTTVAVDPHMSVVNMGDTSTVNINVTSVTDLTAWQLKLYYLNTVLNCTVAVEGPFLGNGSPSGTYFVQNVTNNFNSTHGRILAACTLNGENYSANGSGVILTITFKAVGGGTTDLSLANTKLLNTTMPDPGEISHTDYSGTVDVIGAFHDVAITKVVSHKTLVGQGYAGNITVTVNNLGGYIETFNTTVYANQTIIATRVHTTLTIIESFANLTFTWNTTGFVKGNYTITAYAWPVPSEYNTTNNNCTGGLVKVTFPGDVVGPYLKVDMGDISAVLDAFGSKMGADGNYWHTPPKVLDPHSPNMDIDNNGQVDMGDVTIALDNFGKHYP